MREHGNHGFEQGEEAASTVGTPGKRTRSEGLAVQRRVDGHGAVAPVGAVGDVAAAAANVEDPFALHLPAAAARPIQASGAVNPFASPAPATDAGAPLPGGVQTKMEQSLGADFSAVRIHEGPQAAAIGAQAYTQGTDIHFAPGRYEPESASGQQLLGHELTHVVQQGQGRVTAPAQAKGATINSDPALEREADILGERAARGEPATGASAADAVGVQCQFDDDGGLSQAQRTAFGNANNATMRGKLAAVWALGFALFNRNGRIVYTMNGSWDDARTAATAHVGMALGAPRVNRNPPQAGGVNLLYNETIDGCSVTLRDYSSQAGASGVIEVRYGGEILEFKWMGPSRYDAYVAQQQPAPQPVVGGGAVGGGGGDGGGGGGG